MIEATSPVVVMTERTTVVRPLHGAARRALPAVLLGAALLLGACTDSVSPRAAVARLAIVPVLPASPSMAVLAMNRVRLVVVRPPSTTLLDRVYSFPANASELTIDENVPLIGDVESLEVSVTLLSDATTLFSGSTSVEVRAGRDATPVEVPVDYVGPGANIASLVIAPRDTVIPFGGQVSFRASAIDAQQQPVPDFFVTWSSNDPARVPSATGVLQGGNARATVVVTARAPSGAFSTSTVTVAPPAASIVKVAGDNQSAAVGARLPQQLEVEVRAADNLPVAGAVVSFAAQGGGSVDRATVTTDASGRASTGAVLGPTSGSQGFTASVPGAGSVTFAATASIVVPVVNFVGVQQVTAEGLVTSIVLQLSSATSVPVSVPFSLSGTAGPSDLTINLSPAVISPGATTTSITVAVTADQVAEAEETIIVTLGTPTNATLGASIRHTIIVPEHFATIAFVIASATVAEATAGNMSVQLRMSTVSTRDVSFVVSLSGTATSGVDYRYNNPTLVTLSAGALTAALSVTIIDDIVTEASETVVITITQGTNIQIIAPNQHTITIVDDDVPRIQGARDAVAPGFTKPSARRALSVAR
jgi:hypothetical protein